MLLGVWRELSGDEDQLVEYPLAQRARGDLAELPGQVAEHAPCVALEPAQGLAHALELPGMGVAADLGHQPGRKTRVALPQLDAGLPREVHPLRPRPLVEPAVRRMGDGLLHDGRVDGELLQAVLRHPARGEAGLDGLGQQPLDAFLAVADKDTARRTIALAIERFGGLHILVNNADRTMNKPLVDMSVADWDGIMATHMQRARAVQRVCRAVRSSAASPRPRALPRSFER